MTTEVRPRDGFVEVNGLKLHYLDWGNVASQPVLLLHGASSHAHAWDAFAPTLAGAFHVLALDQRGHGDSDRAPEYPPAEYVRDIDGVVQVLGLRRMVLIGESMGGRHAYLYAAAHPGEVERLVIVDIGPELSATETRRVQEIMHARDEFESEEAVFRQARAGNPRPTDAQLRSRVHHNLALLPNGRLTWKWDKALRDPSIPRLRPTEEESWQAVRAIACPTLLVRGAESDILSSETAERMQREMAKCTLVTIAGSGHGVTGDQPGEFERAVRRWLGV
jgi:esterase